MALAFPTCHKFQWSSSRRNNDCASPSHGEPRTWPPSFFQDWEELIITLWPCVCLGEVPAMTMGLRRGPDGQECVAITEPMSKDCSRPQSSLLLLAVLFIGVQDSRTHQSWDSRSHHPTRPQDLSHSRLGPSHPCVSLEDDEATGCPGLPQCFCVLCGLCH